MSGRSITVKVASNGLKMLLAVSAFVCMAFLAAAASLWVRSYSGGESWAADEPLRKVSLNSKDGCLNCEIEDHDERAVTEAARSGGQASPRFAVPENRSGWRHRRPGYTAWVGDGKWWNRLGFGYGMEMNSRIGPGLTWIRELRYRWITVPYWCLCVVLMPAPTLWIAVTAQRARLLRRARGGICRGCGYDLRASPDCCPECGLAKKGGQEPIQPDDPGPPA